MILGKDYFGVGCWATIINNKNELLLIKRKDKDLWERPGGKLEIGESFENCLVREIKEETDVEIIPESLLLVEQIHDQKNDTRWISLGFFCRYKSGVAKVMEDGKHEEIGWFNIKKLPKITSYTKTALEKYLELIANKNS